MGQTPQNVESYLRWRGDLTLAKSPFTNCDNLIFSKLAYLDFSPLEEALSPTGLPLAEANRRLRGNLHSFSFGDEPGTLLETTCASKRFSTVVLRNFEARQDHSPETGTQFCAMEFVLADNLSYIAFRGTDTSLVGWREDFEISFTSVPAQKLALAYLTRTMQEGHRYLVGGHSKGAHLALFATTFLDKRLSACVERIYLNDGPGLCPDVHRPLWTPEFADKVVRISPEYSVFGRLFEPPFPVLVVSSSNEGVMQHSLNSWLVADGHLDRVAAFDEESDAVASAINDWLGHVTTEEREAFVDALFDALSSKGAKSISELSEEGQFEQVLLSLVLSDDAMKGTAAKLPLRIVFGNALDSLKDVGLVQWLIQDDLAHGLELLALGLFFIFKRAALPIATEVVMGAAIIAMAIDTAIRLRKAFWSIDAVRPRVYLLIASIALYTAVLYKDGALFILSSVVLGTILLGTAWSYAHTALDLYQTRGRWAKGMRHVSDKVRPVVLMRDLRPDRRHLHIVLNTLLAILMAGCGLFVLVAPERLMEGYETVLGGVFLLSGIVQLLTLTRR